MPGIAGPPTIIRPPDPEDSEGAAWWVYALVALFFLSGGVLFVAWLISLL